MCICQIFHPLSDHDYSIYSGLADIISSNGGSVTVAILLPATIPTETADSLAVGDVVTVMGVDYEAVSYNDVVGGKGSGVYDDKVYSKRIVLRRSDTSYDCYIGKSFDGESCPIFNLTDETMPDLISVQEHTYTVPYSIRDRLYDTDVRRSNYIFLNALDDAVVSINPMGDPLGEQIPDGYK